ncbi:MAG TPA: cupin domain-containing protein [Candidatus Binatia bacterium]
MKITTIAKLSKRLKKINREISYASFVEGRGFSAGLILFRPGSIADPKQIKHSDKDVVCQVVRGSGRLRVAGRKVALKPGMLCHIPRGAPHDFAAGKKSRLVLFYSLIETG